jgi:hypothetical protein
LARRSHLAILSTRIKLLLSVATVESSEALSTGGVVQAGGKIRIRSRRTGWIKAAIAVALDRISKDASTLDVRRGTNEKKIYYDSSTKWTKGTKTIEMSEFKEGSDVICLGKADEKGEFHATRIDLRR